MLFIYLSIHYYYSFVIFAPASIANASTSNEAPRKLAKAVFIFDIVSKLKERNMDFNLFLNKTDIWNV